MASDQRARGRVSGRSLLVLLIALLVVSPLGQAGARRVLQVGTSDSPAVGGSQVTTQGISDLPDGEIVYRVVRRTAPARGGAKVGRRVLSVVLATDDPVLLSNERDDGTIEDIARVAPGESYLVQAGTRQIRSSLTDQPVQYLAVEIVQESSGPDIGNGELLFLSDPFTAPDGPRDIDFLRNMLEGNDIGLVPDSGNTVAILATDGAIDILPANGTPTTLQAGESAIFPAGDLEIEAATPTANGVSTNQLASLTSSLQTGPVDAAYVVTVIGEEVPATGVTPSPTASGGTTNPTPVPTTGPEPESSSTPAPAANGTIGVQGFACLTPAGPNFDPTTCSPRTTGYSASITGGGKTFELGDAIPSNDAYYWAGLTLGDYQLSVDPLPVGAAGYLVPPGEGINGTPETGYTVTLSESRPTVTLSIFFYPATVIVPTPTSTPAPAGVTVNLTLWECAGYSESQGPQDCLPVPAGSANQPYLRSAATGAPVDASAASVTGNVYTWTGLPPDGYDVMTTQTTYDMVINGTYFKAGQVYRIILSELPFNLEVYSIRPPVIL